MSSTRARAWCFTVNNPDVDATLQPGDNPLVRYCVWQLEEGATGTRHWQGYAEFTAPLRLGACKTWLPTAHWEPRRGTREQARDYCRKSDSRVDGPWEYGEWGAGGQGKRNDLADAVTALKAGGIKRVAEDHPTAYVKFHRGLRELQRELETRPADDSFEPKLWQQIVLDHLDPDDADDRTIHWVTDTRGGQGKSRLAKHLILQHGAVQLEGKIADMSFMYNKEPIVIFDITRAAAETSDHLYTFAEKLKNGVITSTKYESCQKIFKPPHVIFFANHSYDSSKWTSDRVIEWDLNNPDLHRH